MEVLYAFYFNVVMVLVTLMISFSLAITLLHFYRNSFDVFFSGLFWFFSFFLIFDFIANEQEFAEMLGEYTFRYFYGLSVLFWFSSMFTLIFLAVYWIQYTFSSDYTLWKPLKTLLLLVAIFVSSLLLSLPLLWNLPGKGNQENNQRYVDYGIPIIEFPLIFFVVFLIAVIASVIDILRAKKAELYIELDGKQVQKVMTYKSDKVILAILWLSLMLIPYRLFTFLHHFQKEFNLQSTVVRIYEVKDILQSFFYGFYFFTTLMVTFCYNKVLQFMFLGKDKNLFISLS